MDKISRKRALIDLLALPIAATALASVSSAALAADDSGGTKKQYAYVEKSAHKGQLCSNCTLFKAPNACQVVKGKIAPGGWCKLYAKKAG